MARSSTSWKKGCPSPNPAGRPKNEHSITNMVRKLLDETMSVGGVDVEKRKLMIRRAIIQAIEGDRHAREFLAAYDQSRAPTATERMIMDGELSAVEEIKLIRTPLWGPGPDKETGSDVETDPDEETDDAQPRQAGAGIDEGHDEA
ncbi:MAG: hypothetical protein GY778_17520 [bacterium]|nr:hypothetical protein [bacterium]